MPKNIVIFSDGTAQKGGEGNPSNVYKLFNMVENRTVDQIAYYDPGVGTDWRSILGLAFGTGFGANILDCYEEIYNNYEAGDQIYLIGFSRGAATVRSLAGFIDMFGILPRSRPDLIREAFKLYKKGNKRKREEKIAEFHEQHHTMWTKVRFVGVWDTVAALGFPGKRAGLFVENYVRQPFHDFKLSQGVEYARHAISIDEDRKAFLPVLWEKSSTGAKDRVRQVWFCGSHTDVGGGYYRDELSRIPLMWMLEEAFNKGLRLYNHAEALSRLENMDDLDIEGDIHMERIGFTGKMFKKGIRFWNFNTFGELRVHASVFERKLGITNLVGTKYESWIKAEGLLSKIVVEPWNKAFEFRLFGKKREEGNRNQGESETSVREANR